MAAERGTLCGRRIYCAWHIRKIQSGKAGGELCSAEKRRGGFGRARGLRGIAAGGALAGWGD